MIQAKHHKLCINDLRLPVTLGWFEEERAEPQEISIEICIQFNKAPVAISNDQLSNTHCYAQITETVKAALKDREFKLIEYCAYAIYSALKQTIDDDVSVTIKKLQVPIDEVKGFTSYSCADF